MEECIKIQSGPIASLWNDHVIRWGILVVGLALAVFIGWAALAPLSQGVVGQGTLVADSKRKTVQHLEGGIIKAIHVRDGSRVQKDQTLIELDLTQAQAQYDLLKTRYLTSLAVLNRLNSERAGFSEIEFSPELSAIEGNQELATIIAMQIKFFADRQHQFHGQSSLLEQRARQLEEQVEGLAFELTAREKELSLMADELRRTEELQRKRLVDLPRVLSLQREQAKTSGLMGRTKADIAAAKVAIGEARMEILQLEKTRNQDLSEQLEKVQEQVYELRRQMHASKDVLERTTIRAPESGTVFGLNIYTVGGVIPPGTPILQIVPTNDRLLVEAKITINQIDEVQKGMPVRVRFSAFRQRTTPLVEGSVEEISADAVDDERTGQSFYLVRIGVPESEMVKLVGLEIVPGMPAEVLIKGGDRTAMEYFLDPLTSMLRRSMREN